MEIQSSFKLARALGGSLKISSRRTSDIRVLETIFEIKVKTTHK